MQVPGRTWDPVAQEMSPIPDQQRTYDPVAQQMNPPYWDEHPNNLQDVVYSLLDDNKEYEEDTVDPHTVDRHYSNGANPGEKTKSNP